MKLTELEAEFLKRIDDTHFQRVDALEGADGIIFVCPKCVVANGNSRRGIHSVICWQPHVPQTTHPTPGRWKFTGTWYADLTLDGAPGKSRSILLTGGGCGWHGYITNREITSA